MRLTSNIIEKLIPSDFPANNSNFLEIVLRSEEIESQNLRRSYLWANAILTSFYYRPFLQEVIFNRSLKIPLRTSNISAGFVYINSELANDFEEEFPIFQSFAFGAYALVPSDKFENRQEVIVIEVSGRKIPLVINYGRFIPHGCPPHPIGGTGCCWVKNLSKSSKWSKGILVSRHVVSNYPLGATIPFNSSLAHYLPNTGNLADIDACTIDAAIVEIDPIDWPTNLSSLPISKATAPGSSTVSFDGQFTSQSGTILRIYQDPTYFGNLMGHRIITDCFGTPGDSGSLLIDNYNAGLGVYMGSIPDGNGGSEGIFQDLNQVKKYFEIDLFN